MRTLVINLTRFGDLLQTQPVLSGFKRLGHQVGLVCLENFAGATGLLRGVDQVFPLPGARLLADLNGDWKQGVQDFWNWADSGCKRFQPELIVNLTSSISARLLAGFLQDAEKRGFCLDEHGFGWHTNTWAAFLMASSRHRGASPYNLVDQFKRSAELPPDREELSLKSPEEKTRNETLAMLRRESPEDAEGFVALQLGASSEIRRWPVKYFAAVADALWKKHRLCPVLLGSAGEVDLGRRFAVVAQEPHINLIGKTSLPQLAAALVNTRLIITNDTGTMHLAAGLNVSVAAIFLATAQPWDTGPYKSRCLCLEPDIDCHPCGFATNCPASEACREMITPQAVLDYIEKYLSGDEWESVPAKGERAWVTEMDDTGFMGLISLSGHEAQDRSIWIRMQRMLYSQFIDGGDIEHLSWHGPPLSRDFAVGLLEELGGAEKMLFLMLEQIRLIGQSPSPQMRNKFLSNWQRLTSRWVENPKLSVLGDLWREQSQIVTGDLTALESLVQRYRNLVSAFLACLKTPGMDIE